jgi:glycosyltransferase involved in cell wall biosynthesis
MQNVTRPFFSVVVPTRDRSEWLQKCIDAILCQTFKDFEVVIIDNDSDDKENSKKIFNANALDSRLRYKRTGGLGMAENWQVAVEEAQAEYVIVCSDKLLLQSWLLDDIFHLISRQDLDAVVWQIGDYGKLAKKNNWHKQSIVYGNQIMDSAMSCSWRLLWDAGPRGMNSAFRKSLVERVKNDLGVPICRMICPDFNIALSLAALDCKILSTDIIGSVFLPNAHGNGMKALLAKDNQSLRETFEFPELDCLPVKYLTGITAISCDILSTYKNYYFKIKNLQFNWEGFYINLIHEAVNADLLGGFSVQRKNELIKSLAANSIKFRLSLLKIIIEQEIKNLVKRKKSIKIQFSRFFRLLKYPIKGLINV